MSTAKSNARAIGYIRVSTDQQRESGLGLEAQRAAIEETAARLHLALTSVHVDAGLSGSLAIDDRPALADVLNTVRRGDTIIVAKRDRLARDAFLSVLIEREVAKKGGRILSAAGEGTDRDDPSATFTRRILDAVAELERALIAARTRAALKAKRARGERAGTEPVRIPRERRRRHAAPLPARAADSHPDAGLPRRRVSAPSDCGRAQPCRAPHPDGLTLAVRVRAIRTANARPPYLKGSAFAAKSAPGITNSADARLADYFASNIGDCLRRWLRMRMFGELWTVSRSASLRPERATEHSRHGRTRVAVRGHFEAPTNRPKHTKSCVLWWFRPRVRMLESGSRGVSHQPGASPRAAA